MLRHTLRRLAMEDPVCSKVLFAYKRVTEFTPYGVADKTMVGVLNDLQMLKSTGAPGTLTFERALHVLEQGGVGACKRVMEEYKNITPKDVNVYKKYLKICAAQRAGNAAENALREMHSENLAVPTTLIHDGLLACRYSDVNVLSMLKFWEAVDRKVITSKTYVAALTACSTLEVAMQLTRLHPEMLDQTHLVALINVASRTGTLKAVEEVESLREELTEKNIRPTIHYYNMLMKIYRGLSRNGEVVSLFETLQQNGPFPDIFTYNMVISSLVLLSKTPNDANAREAERLFTLALPLATTPHIFTSLMTLYAKYPKANVPEAERLVEKYKSQMKRSNITEPMRREYCKAVGKEYYAKLRDTKGKLTNNGRKKW